MTKVNISKFKCFTESGRLDKLNAFFDERTEAMPREIAAQTGCGLREAMSLLMFLFHLYLAEAFILVYHNEHPETPISKRSLIGGLPTLPMQCEDCDDEIENPDQLSYEFWFKFKSKISLYTET